MEMPGVLGSGLHRFGHQEDLGRLDGPEALLVPGQKIGHPVFQQIREQASSERGIELGPDPSAVSPVQVPGVPPAVQLLSALSDEVMF
jgi:hypothetical protein